MARNGESPFLYSSNNTHSHINFRIVYKSPSNFFIFFWILGSLEEFLGVAVDAAKRAGEVN